MCYGQSKLTFLVFSEKEGVYAKKYLWKFMIQFASS